MNQRHAYPLLVAALVVSYASADDKPAPKKLACFESSDGPHFQAIAPDSSKLAFSQRTKDGSELVLLDLATGKVLHRSPCRQGWQGLHCGHKGYGEGVFSADGKRLALTFAGRPNDRPLGEWRQDVSIWDVENWKEIHTLQAPDGWSLPSPVAFSPDGKALAGKCQRSGPRDVDWHVPVLWDLKTGKVRPLGEGEKKARDAPQGWNQPPIRFPATGPGAVHPQLEPGAMHFADDGSDLLFVQYAGLSVVSLAQDKTVWNEPQFWQRGARPGTATDRFRFRQTPGGRFLALPNYQRPPLAAYADEEGVVSLVSLSRADDAGLYGGLPAKLPQHEHGTLHDFRALRSRPTVVLSGDGTRLVAAGLFAGDATKGRLVVWDVSGPLAEGRKLSAVPAQERDRLWGHLFEPFTDADKIGAGPVPARTLAAMLALSRQPHEATAFVRRRLGPAVERAAVRGWLADLDSRDFQTRARAQRELEGLGHAAGPALVDALKADPPLDARKRLERLLERLKETEVAYELRVFRVVDVLEHLRTDESRKLLRELEGGSHGPLYAAAAKAALCRMR